LADKRDTSLTKHRTLLITTFRQKERTRKREEEKEKEKE